MTDLEKKGSAVHTALPQGYKNYLKFLSKKIFI